MAVPASAKFQKFDDVLQHTGEAGLYQVVIVVLLMLFSFWGVEVVSITFVAGDMPHWCRVSSLTSLPPAQQRYIASPLVEDAHGASGYSQCSAFALNYSRYSLEALQAWNRSAIVTEETPLVGCEAGWVYDADTFLSTSVSRYDLVCSRKWLVQLASTVYIFGILIGSVTSGAISDRIGRKKTIFIYLLLKLLGLFLSAYAPTYTTFALARFFVGIGTTGCFLSGYVLSMELVGPYYRTIVGGLFNLAFSLGFMAQPALSYFLRDDRKLQLAIAIPNILFLSYWFILPESPRWLVANERDEEALVILRKMARVNKRHLPDSIHFDHTDKTTTTVESKATVLDLFRTSKIRNITLIIYLHWFVDSLIYYGLSLNTSRLSGNVFLNTLIMGAVEIPANLACIFLLNWYLSGRRLTCSLSHIAAAATSFATVPFFIFGMGTWATVLSIIGKGFVTIGFSGIYVFSAELYPTEVRNIGMGTASMCARISGMLAPFVSGPLASVWPSLPSVIFGLFACLSGALSFMLPETRGEKLYETVVEFSQRISEERPSSVELIKRVNDSPEMEAGLNGHPQMQCENEKEILSQRL